MTAADAASSFAFRFRQSFSRRARRCSASRLDSRSSWAKTGMPSSCVSRINHFLRARGLLGERAVEPAGQADHHCGNRLVLLQFRDDCAKVCNRCRVRAVSRDRLQRPRQCGRGIAHGNSDPPLAEVEADHAHDTRVPHVDRSIVDSPWSIVDGRWSMVDGPWGDVRAHAKIAIHS